MKGGGATRIGHNSRGVGGVAFGLLHSYQGALFLRSAESISTAVAIK